jgi:hypothetical protein
MQKFNHRTLPPFQKLNDKHNDKVQPTFNSIVPSAELAAV